MRALFYLSLALAITYSLSEEIYEIEAIDADEIVDEKTIEKRGAVDITYATTKAPPSAKSTGGSPFSASTPEPAYNKQQQVTYEAQPKEIYSAPQQYYYAEQQPQQIAYSPQQIKYTLVPQQFAYVQPKIAYAQQSAPKVAYAQPTKIAYAQQEGGRFAYVQPESAKFAYAAAPQPDQQKSAIAQFLAQHAQLAYAQAPSQYEPQQLQQVAFAAQPTYKIASSPAAYKIAPPPAAYTQQQPIKVAQPQAFKFAYAPQPAPAVQPAAATAVQYAKVAPSSPQQVTYTTTPVKVAYAQAPVPVGHAGPPGQAIAVHYSPASAVSQFHYISPLVHYSNEGILKAQLGNVAAGTSKASAAYALPQQVYAVQQPQHQPQYEQQQSQHQSQYVQQQSSKYSQQ